MIKNAVFLGSKKLGFEVLKAFYEADSSVEWTILCLPDHDDPRSCYQVFEEFSEQKSVSFFTATSPKLILECVKELNPDFMIVCGYYRILPSEIFCEVSHGVWGIHNSMLPRYRGGSPLVWQIINNEKTFGSSFFKLSHGFDDGPILDQVSIANTETLCISDATDMIESEWIKRIPSMWTKFCEGTIEPKEQSHSDATYCAQRRDVDAEIDWCNEASYIDRFIRAQAKPYPGAHFFFNDKKVKILKHAKDNRVIFGSVGQVFEIKDNDVVVCCGNNTALRLIELQVDERVVKPSEILYSIKLRI
jgi:methionyl-tRNA formyltransferase